MAKNIVFFPESSDKTSSLQFMDRTPKIKSDPTDQIYAQLQVPYRHFNKELFSNALPDCVLTLTHNSKRTLGYFRPGGFKSMDGQIIDEIAMNPRIFLEVDLAYVLSIIVHEMAHQWKHHFGKRRGKGGYHCKEWGTKMDEIGLPPSNTGKPGGARTGYQMMHYIEKNGAFDLSCQKLFDQDFAMQWGFAQQQLINRKSGNKAAPDKRKSKFQCPECKASVWGKPDSHVLCGYHKVLMAVVL